MSSTESSSGIKRWPTNLSTICCMKVEPRNFGGKKQEEISPSSVIMFLCFCIANPGLLNIPSNHHYAFFFSSSVGCECICLSVNTLKVEGEIRGSSVLYHFVPLAFEMWLSANLTWDLSTEQSDDRAVSPGPGWTGSECAEPFPITNEHLTLQCSALVRDLLLMFV